MLKLGFNPNILGKTKTFIILSFLLFLSSSAVAVDSLQVIMTFEDSLRFGGYNLNRSGSDLNNDGYDDFIGGSLTLDTLGIYELRFLFYFGSPNPDPIPDIEFNVDLGNGHRSWGGDLNNDGYKDLVYNTSYQFVTNAGDIHICFGGDTIDIEPDLTLYGNNYAVDPFDLHFHGCNPGVDFNGDGYDDILAGGPGPSLFFNGQVDLFFGGEEIDTIPDFHIRGAEGDQFGKLKTVGDINGDGYDDLIASRNIPNGQLYWHKFEIYFGGPDIDLGVDYLLPEVYENEISTKCTAMGDLNGDGCDDLVVGENNIYVYFGNPESNFVCDSIDVGGIREVFYCDLNNDQYDDLVAFRHMGDNENYVYVYFGKPDFNTDCAPDIIINLTGTYNDLYYACCCFNLGDFNGDGGDEIVISNGSPYTTANVYTLGSGPSIEDNYKAIGNYEINSYPNPFSISTTISFNLHSASWRTESPEIKIYNIKGQLVRELGFSPPAGGSDLGFGEAVWDGKDNNGHNPGPGIYFIKLKTEKETHVRKIVKLSY